MLKGSVPINHKEDDKCQSQVHDKEYPSASAVFFQLTLHLFAGLIFSRVIYQRKAHQSKADIIRAQRVEPKGSVIESEPKLENTV